MGWGGGCSSDFEDLYVKHRALGTMKNRLQYSQMLKYFGLLCGEERTGRICIA